MFRFLTCVYKYVCFDSSENQEVMWNIRRVIVDCCDAEINAIEAFSREQGLNTRVRICWFHIKQAVTR